MNTSTKYYVYSWAYFKALRDFGNRDKWLKLARLHGAFKENGGLRAEFQSDFVRGIEAGQKAHR